MSTFKQRGSYSAVIRVISFTLPHPSELHIPDAVMQLPTSHSFFSMYYISLANFLLPSLISFVVDLDIIIHFSPSLSLSICLLYHILNIDKRVFEYFLKIPYKGVNKKY